MALSIQSDNRGAFIAKLTQEVCETVKIQWNLQASWRPQSTEKMEKMNCTLNKRISKIRQEKNLTWDKVLPVALLSIRVAPELGFS